MSRKSNNSIIELYGLPGAGKSTLAKRLQSEYGYTIVSHKPKQWRVITLTCRYPRVVLCWCTIIFKNFLKTNSISIAAHNLSLLFSSLQKIDTAKNDTSGIVQIIDEGLIQRFLSYADILLSEKDIQRLLEVSPTGSHVVLVNDREPQSNRYQNADNVRTKLGPEYLERWQSNQRVVLLALSQALIRTKKGRFYATAEMSVDGILTAINQV